MDPVRFDTLVKSLATSGTRRRLVGLLTALPLSVAVVSMFADGRDASAQNDDHGSSHRRHRRRARRCHGSDRNKTRGKNKPKRKKQCIPKSRARSCAGVCGTVTNNCGQPVECEPCTCATGCLECQMCDPATGVCVLMADGAACDDGDACTQTDTCQDGQCVRSNPVDCTPANECQESVCNPFTGSCSAPTSKPANTPCNGGGDVCCGGTCQARDCCDNDGCAGSAICLSNGSCAIPCDQSSNDCCGNCVPTEPDGSFCVTNESATTCDAPLDCSQTGCPRGQVCDHDGCAGSMPGCVPLCR